MSEFGGNGILSDVHKQRVIDVKGRDSRREVDRWNALIDFYRDQVWVPDNFTKH